LNSLPGIRMSGENNNALTHIVDAVNKVRYEKNWKQWGKSSASWMHNEVHKSSYACLVQHFMETINPPKLWSANVAAAIPEDDSTIVGFKTIRLLEKSSQVSHVAHIIRDNLPCSRVVINYRSDVTSQIKSAKKLAWLTTVDSIAEQNSALRELAKELGPRRVFLLDSSEWTKNITNFNDMIGWLGFREECAFKTAFQYNTNKSGYGVGKGGVSGRAIPPKCVPLAKYVVPSTRAEPTIPATPATTTLSITIRRGFTVGASILTIFILSKLRPIMPATTRRGVKALMK